MALMEKVKKAYILFAGNPEGKRPFGRPKYRWNDVKMYRKEI
jgi:hypothetical protein